MILQAKFTGLLLNQPYPIRRYNIDTPDQRGSGLMAFGRFNANFERPLFDLEGNPHPFYTDTPRLLTVGGRCLLRHAAIPVAPWGDNYAIAANSRLFLVTSETEFGLPNWNQFRPGGGTRMGLGDEIMLHGQNIHSAQDHYHHTNFNWQGVIQPGWHRLEFWVSAITDAWDVDGLVELPDYNQENTHQFWMRLD